MPEATKVVNDHSEASLAVIESTLKSPEATKVVNDHSENAEPTENAEAPAPEATKVVNDHSEGCWENPDILGASFPRKREKQLSREYPAGKRTEPRCGCPYR